MSEAAAGWLGVVGGRLSDLLNILSQYGHGTKTRQSTADFHASNTGTELGSLPQELTATTEHIPKPRPTHPTIHWEGFLPVVISQISFANTTTLETLRGTRFPPSTLITHKPCNLSCTRLHAIMKLSFFLVRRRRKHSARIAPPERGGQAAPLSSCLAPLLKFGTSPKKTVVYRGHS